MGNGNHILSLPDRVTGCSAGSIGCTGAHAGVSRKKKNEEPSAIKTHREKGKPNEGKLVLEKKQRRQGETIPCMTA